MNVNLFLFIILFENIKPQKLYFLRDTSSPNEDLIRNFSCNVNAWLDNEQEAIDYQRIHGGLDTPKQDPKTKLWCADPELGLSSFSFYDETSFNEALKNIEPYINYKNKIAVFVSDEYELGAGLDGEDTFKNGKFLGYIIEPYTWENVSALLNR